MTGEVDVDLNSRIPQAVNAWGRSVFGGPRNLTRLVVGLPEVRDEIIERVFTRVVRREIGEAFAPTRETRTTRARVDSSAIDPFAYTNETLRADSEYVRQCPPCGASGSVRCSRCSGTGTMRCGDCNGSGKELKYYKTRSPKLINCKRCRAAGTVRCADCTGSGAVTCASCHGSGHVLSWLTISQTDHAHVILSPDSAVIAGHPVLAENRELVPADVAAFAVTEQAVNDGPLAAAGGSEPYRNAEAALVQDHLSRVNPRLERVTRQQYLKLAVVRRDVKYEMCGVAGTLVLSGRDLTPSTTPEALRPVKRRLYAWAGAVVLVAAVLAVIRGSLLGSSAYFDDARGLTGVVTAFGVVLSVPTFGGLLRAWRGGRRFWPMQSAIKVGLIAIGLCAVADAGVGLLTRPSAREVQAALAKGDVARARTVVDALKEQSDDAPSTLDAEDRVRLAESKALKGDDQLKVLDAVAARGGSSANEAALAARADRLKIVDDELAAKRSADALESLDRWFTKSNTDGEIAEDRARAHEVAHAACATDVCRLAESTQARQAHPTSQRTAQLDKDRASVNAALDPKQLNSKDTLERLRQARTLRDTANEAIKEFPTDSELVAMARASKATAEAERSKITLLRSPMPVVEELLESPSQPDGKGVAHVACDGVTVYVALDDAQRCSGLYAVGSGGQRSYVSNQWPADRLLSQAVGHSAKLHQPTQGAQASATWYESGYPVVARWRDGNLIELRIGDATP